MEAKEVRKSLISTTTPSSAASGSNSYDVTSYRRMYLRGTSGSRPPMFQTQTIVGQLLKKDPGREA